MTVDLLKTYIKAFTKLNRATKNRIKAPHKPILLLAVIQSIETGEIKENRIFITPELVARFKDYWKWLVEEPFFSPNFSLPFFHLRSDKFWHLKTYLGKEILLTSSYSVKSFSQLRESVQYASLDDGLFSILQTEHSRQIIFRFLLDHYFPGKKLYDAHTDLFESVTKQILHDSPVEYLHIIERADEEEVFIRSGVFKKVIPRIYDYTCCISGLRIISGYDIQMVDACHIVPFASSHNDTISNGISLCPNLHRAFDRGLLSIDQEYRVVVTANIIESSVEKGITSYHGKPILLPKEKNYHPASENLQWHRENIFRQ
jgi:putative restriction endonuclease